MRVHQFQCHDAKKKDFLGLLLPSIPLNEPLNERWAVAVGENRNTVMCILFIL